MLPCTLIPYDPAFEMGSTLAEAASGRRRHVRGRRRQAVPSALLQVLRAGRRQLLVATRYFFTSASRISLR